MNVTETVAFGLATVTYMNSNLNLDSSAVTVTNVEVVRQYYLSTSSPLSRERRWLEEEDTSSSVATTNSNDLTIQITAECPSEFSLNTISHAVFDDDNDDNFTTYLKEHPSLGAFSDSYFANIEVTNFIELPSGIPSIAPSGVPVVDTPPSLLLEPSTPSSSSSSSTSPHALTNTTAEVDGGNDGDDIVGGEAPSAINGDGSLFTEEPSAAATESIPAGAVAGVAAAAAAGSAAAASAAAAAGGGGGGGGGGGDGGGGDSGGGSNVGESSGDNKTSKSDSSTAAEKEARKQMMGRNNKKNTGRAIAQGKKGAARLKQKLMNEEADALESADACREFRITCLAVLAMRKFDNHRGIIGKYLDRRPT